VTDLTPDTIAQIRNRAENAITYGVRQMTFHPTEVIALLDRIEAAERALVCADAYVHHSTHDNYEDYKSARSQCPALLRGKDVFDFTENQRKAG